MSNISKLVSGLFIALGLSFGAPAMAQCPTGVDVSNLTNPSAPPPWAFTGSGTGLSVQTAIGASAVCNVYVEGTIDECGYVTLSTFDISAGDFLCNFASAGGLPWEGEATSPTTIQMEDVIINTALVGSCGPDSVEIEFIPTDILNFNNATWDGCTANGSLQLDTEFDAQ